MVQVGGVQVGGVISSAATDMGWHYLDILDKIVLDICRIIDYLHEAFDNTLSNDFMHFRQHWVLCVQNCTLVRCAQVTRQVSLLGLIAQEHGN